MCGGSTIVFFCWAFYFQHLTSLPWNWLPLPLPSEDHAWTPWRRALALSIGFLPFAVGRVLRVAFAFGLAVGIATFAFRTILSFCVFSTPFLLLPFSILSTSVAESSEETRRDHLCCARSHFTKHSLSSWYVMPSESCKLKWVCSAAERQRKTTATLTSSWIATPARFASSKASSNLSSWDCRACPTLQFQPPNHALEIHICASLPYFDLAYLATILCQKPKMGCNKLKKCLYDVSPDLFHTQTHIFCSLFVPTHFPNYCGIVPVPQLKLETFGRSDLDALRPRVCGKSPHWSTKNVAHGSVHVLVAEEPPEGLLYATWMYLV